MGTLPQAQRLVEFLAMRGSRIGRSGFRDVIGQFGDLLAEHALPAGNVDHARVVFLIGDQELHHDLGHHGQDRNQRQRDDVTPAQLTRGQARCAGTFWRNAG